MRKSKTVLGDICKITMGQSPDSSTYNTTNIGLPFYQGNADFGELYPKTRIWCSEPQKIAEPENILLSVRAPIGALNIAKEKCCIGRGLAAITPHKNFCFNKYLFYILKYKHNELNARGTGSTFKAINKSILNNLPIDIYSIDRQKRIAAILDKATELIALRKQQIQKLDLLVKSRFIEMFGTYPVNPLGWETGIIRDVVADIRYGSSRPAVDGGKYPYLRMNNITYNGELDLSDTKRIDIPDNELDKCTVRRGDVLFNRTNSKELVGKTCVYDRDELMILAGFVIRVRVTERILPEFLSAFLNADFSKKMLLSICKTAVGQANINAQEMQNIGLYLPPIELQQQFIHFKKQVDKTKSTLQQSLEKLELNYKALMQTYFG